MRVFCVKTISAREKTISKAASAAVRHMRVARLMITVKKLTAIPPNANIWNSRIRKSCDLSKKLSLIFCENGFVATPHLYFVRGQNLFCRPPRYSETSRGFFAFYPMYYFRALARCENIFCFYVDNASCVFPLTINYKL